MTTIDSPVLTFKEACAYLKRGSTWLKLHADEIPAVRDGGRIAFLLTDLDAYLARHRTQTQAKQEPTPIRRAAPDTTQHRHATNPVSKAPWTAAPPPRAERLGGRG